MLACLLVLARAYSVQESYKIRTICYRSIYKIVVPMIDIDAHLKTGLRPAGQSNTETRKSLSLKIKHYVGIIIK